MQSYIRLVTRQHVQVLAVAGPLGRPSRFTAREQEIQMPSVDRPINGKQFLSMTRTSNLLSALLALVSPCLTFTPPTGEWSTYAADSAISRGQGNGLHNGVPLVDYPDGVFQWALRLCVYLAMYLSNVIR